MMTHDDFGITAQTLDAYRLYLPHWFRQEDSVDGIFRQASRRRFRHALQQAGGFLRRKSSGRYLATFHAADGCVVRGRFSSKSHFSGF